MIRPRIGGALDEGQSLLHAHAAIDPRIAEKVEELGPVWLDGDRGLQVGLGTLPVARLAAHGRARKQHPPVDDAVRVIRRNHIVIELACNIDAIIHAVEIACLQHDFPPPRQRQRLLRRNKRLPSTLLAIEGRRLRYARVGRPRR